MMRTFTLHFSIKTLAVGLALILSQPANATTFAMPKNGDSLIDNNHGQPKYIKAKAEDSLIDIAIRYLLGQEEIVRANKTVDRWLPGAGKEVLIPTSYLLPDAPRQGVVINLPEYRLYYYPPASSPSLPKTAKPAPRLDATPALSNLPVIPAPVVISPPQPPQVISYSVGIGRVDWKTPLGVTKVVGKVQNPTWTPPETIKAEHLAKGDPLPDVWPAGPDNPLGLFAFRLGIPGYLLHSTNKPQGIGMQISHGCMRLYPKDVEQLFSKLGVGEQVNIINQPVKVGWSNGQLYIESHPNLEGEETSYQQRLDIALALIEKATQSQPTGINGAALRTALEENNGIPVVISNNDPQLSTPPASELSSPVLNISTLATNLPEGSVSIDVIQEELRQEEMQEREFKNSPFPR
jgi:L,D-transpeptidase ErfK/SrfK